MRIINLTKRFIKRHDTVKFSVIQNFYDIWCGLTVELYCQAVIYLMINMGMRKTLIIHNVI